MAPREEGSGTNSSPPAANRHGTSHQPTHFWNKLLTIPILKSTMEAYNFQKKEGNSLLSLGLSVVESGMKVSMAPVAVTANLLSEYFPSQAKRIDEKACEYVGTLEENLPASTFSANEIFGQVVHRSNKAIRHSLRTAILSSPGRKVLQGVDFLLNKSQLVVDCLTGDQQMESPVKIITSPRQKKSAVHFSESLDVLTKPKTNILRGLVVTPIVIPIKTMLWVIRTVRQKVFSLAGSRRSKRLSSKSDKAKIASRRMASPVKRHRPSSNVQRLINTVLRPFGISLGHKALDITSVFQALPTTKDNKDKIESNSAEKRKYSDISSSEESDVDIDNLENYLSDDDPTYHPEDFPSSDSMEFAEGDTESDIDVDEFTIATNGAKMKCLKENGHNPMSEDSNEKKVEELSTKISEEAEKDDKIISGDNGEVTCLEENKKESQQSAGSTK